MMTTTACSFPTSDLAKVSKSKLRLGVSKSCSISQSPQSSNLSRVPPLSAGWSAASLSHGANPEQKSIHVEVQGGQILSYGPRKHLPLLPIAVNGSTLAPFPLSSDALKPVKSAGPRSCPSRLYR